MIDLSIVILTWNTREFVLERLGNSRRRRPTPARIEYHRSLHRCFRKNRGRGRMAIPFVLRIAKSLFRALGLAREVQVEARR